MSPPVGTGQKPPPHPVPEAVGTPVPHRAKASRADKAAAKAAARVKTAKKAARAAARKADARRRKVQSQVLKGKLGVDEGRVKIGLEPLGTPGTAIKGVLASAPLLPAAEASALDTESVAAAVKAATAPLAKQLKAQARTLRKNQKVLDAVAGQPDTTGAPFRGAGVYNKASAAPAAPQTAAEAAAQAQTGNIQRLQKQWRESYNPAEREAAWQELTAQLGINPMTGTPDTNHPFRT
jgi:hypothetical protein